MRRWIASVMIGLVAVSCGGSGGGGSGSDDTGAIVAAALHHLATADTTFGEGFRFDLLLVLDHPDPNAGAEASSAGGGPVYEPEVRATIEGRLSAVSPMRWVSDADAWRTDRLEPVEPGSAILGAGMVSFDGDVALVPVSLWCGGTCGLWTTYLVERVDGEWTVTGTEGPVAIS